eukprot:TRINITY_DN11797_c1_g1_i1.p1 TRINITY_DN11797_c1_g1~~TRINITY_DN11797_c1_g1_i1.p1  ORF type:complete len:409 (-),score=45.16 TRINITY_DN11797_c1_g1_i1:72-1298(-)
MNVGSNAVAGASDNSDMSSTAFVTLNSTVHSLEAQQVVLTHEVGWRISAAPEPCDLLMHNVTSPLENVRRRHILALLACMFGVFFWSVPVTLIQAWASINSLQRWLPGVVHLWEFSPLIYSFLTAYLPALALMGLQAVLPYIFEALAAHFEGHKLKSEVQRAVLSRCFAYQLVSLYVTVLSGSVWEDLQKIIDHPGSLSQILAHSLPNGATYFVTFVLSRAFTGLPLLLLRPSVFCCGHESRATGLGPVSKHTYCAFGSEAASAALVFVLGLTYSFIAPAILPACLIYFAFATLSYRWLFAHAYQSEFDGLGDMWYILFGSLTVGLFLGTVSLTGMAGVYGNNAQFVAVLPLPFLVLGLYVDCERRYGRKSQFIPLEDAIVADSEGALVELRQSCYACEASQPAPGSS